MGSGSPGAWGLEGVAVEECQWPRQWAGPTT
jgi:hypothetical protein